MSNCHYIDFVIERTVHQLALNKQLLEGHPTSELAKWRFLIEKTLSAVLNEKENCKRIQILTSYIEENQTQNSLKESEMKYKESLLDHTKSNEKDGKNKILSLKESDQNLKEEISLLKDSIDKFIEVSNQKFEKCQGNERYLVECFNREFCGKLKQSEEEMNSLVKRIEIERHRHTEKRKELCAAIEELSENLKNLRDNWDDLKTKLSNEKKDLIYRRDDILTPQINDLTHKLNERKSVVDECNNARMLAEEQQKALIKFSFAIVRIQSWWRGVLARRDYVRFKMAAQKPTKPRKSRK